MPAEPRLRLEECDAVAGRQPVGGGKAGHAAADHGDPPAGEGGGIKGHS